MTVTSYNKPLQVITYNLRTGKIDVVIDSVEIDDSLSQYLAKPEAIAFKSTNGLDTHAFYYPPTNADYVAPKVHFLLYAFSWMAAPRMPTNWISIGRSTTLPLEALQY